MGIYRRRDEAGFPVILEHGHVCPNGHDSRPWLDFIEQPRGARWFAVYYLNLDTADPNDLPTYHLVAIRAVDTSFLAAASAATRIMPWQRKG